MQQRGSVTHGLPARTYWAAGPQARESGPSNEGPICIQRPTSCRLTSTSPRFAVDVRDQLKQTGEIAEGRVDVLADVVLQSDAKCRDAGVAMEP
jgi:hypothetical protein